MSPKTEIWSEQKVYRPSLSFRDSLGAAYFGAFAIFSCILLLWFLLNPQFSLNIPGKIILTSIWVPLILASVGAFLWRITKTLVTSPEGIAFSRTGFRIFTPWSNVECISTWTERRLDGKRSVSGLKLRQHAPVYKVSILGYSMLMAVEGEPSCFIPIGDVVKDWQYSEIVEDIRRYAPEALRLFTSHHDL